MATSADRGRLFLLGGVIAGLLALEAAILLKPSITSVQGTVAQFLAALPFGETTGIPGIAPRTVELPTETARKVRAAVKQHDHATADKIVADMLAKSKLEYWHFYPFGDFAANFVDADDPDLEAALNGWVQHDPDAAAPLLMRAQFYNDVAWQRRGHKFANETPADDFAAFDRYLQMAYADASAAVQRDPKNPEGEYVKLTIATGGGLSDMALAAFNEGIERFPTYYPLYSLVLDKLQPKWGGDVDAMYAFVEKYAGGANQYSPLKLLYVELYGSLLETAEAACYGKEGQDRADCVTTETRSLIRPELERELPNALALYDHTDEYQFGAEIEGIMYGIVNEPGADTHAGAILELVATSMHSSAELMDVPRQNNYIVDKLVADSWLQKKSYSNALQKAREAFDDIKNTSFPGEAEKDLAVAGVLETIASAEAGLGDVDAAIANEKEAIILGDAVYEERYICSQYYAAKDYSNAIRACTQAIDYGANALEARYWRGLAYQDSGNVNAALADWEIVAATYNQYRANAVINMDLIYSHRGDDKTALDVLNKYETLYDPRVTDRYNVAVLYNNRCYSRMRLGQLKEALDDCTESLKYGSIPDAYDKQLKLMKMLDVASPTL